MKIRFLKIRGTALILSLVFATLLLEMVIAYTKMVQQAPPQNFQIDERVKMDFLSQGLIEKAILKFQLFPADYYAANDALKLNKSDYIKAFVIGDSNLMISNFAEASSSFSDSKINVCISSMSLLTNFQYNQEAIRIQSQAVYTGKNGKNIEKDVVRTVRLNRQSNAPFK